MTTNEHGATLEVAVVGYGLGGATFHAPFIEATPGMRVSAIVTRDADRRARAGRDFPSARLVDTVD
ncbi:MAG: oxidoreductase, partial [bacterium]